MTNEVVVGNLESKLIKSPDQVFAEKQGRKIDKVGSLLWTGPGLGIMYGGVNVVMTNEEPIVQTIGYIMTAVGAVCSIYSGVVRGFQDDNL